MIYLYLFLILFAGYLIGRFSHIIGGHLNTPHHWIYGLILVIGGIIFISRLLGEISVAFGVGLFISDLKDFWQMRFFGPDEPGKKSFWQID